jgi:hypothetical protein
MKYARHYIEGFVLGLLAGAVGYIIAQLIIKAVG